MQRATSTDMHPDADPSRLRLRLRLLDTSGFQTILLESACILRPRLEHRLDFGAGRPVETVLTAEMALLVREIVEPLRDDAPGRSLSMGVMLAEPGLVLADAEIEAAGADLDGSRRMTVTFGHLIGRLQALFSAAVTGDVPTRTRREAMGVRTLEEVAMPLLDLAQALTARPEMEIGAGAAQTLERRLLRIAANVEELRLHAELLRRHASGCDEDVTQIVDVRMVPPAEGIPLRRQ